MIKEIRASTDAAMRNQGASIKTLEIQIGKISKILQERGFGSLPSSTEANPRDHVKSILTTAEADSNSIRHIGLPQYTGGLFHSTKKKGSYRLQFLKAYSYKSSHIDKSIPRKEKDPRSFTLPCYINNVCFDNALADLGASIRGDDEVELTDEESSDDKDEVAEVFRINTNLFNFETPMCKAFKEFNYLLQIDPDLLTKDIEGFKTYEDYKDDWIYEWNKDVPWVDEKPWTNAGVWTKPTPVKHTCKPFNYKTGCSEWPTCSWKDDGYCNGGNLPETYIIGNQLHYQDYEWYEALEDSELKDEALRNKAIMEGFIKEDDDESRYEQKRRWNIYTNYDDAYEINHEDNEREELCEVHELPVCNVRRYMMIKYSFNNDEEYVAVKEDEYDDLTITREEACRAYQEIFRIMDEGWMVTRAE
ncbi:hypothetical protein Tco_0943140 [Tanacetum coccineum]